MAESTPEIVSDNVQGILSDAMAAGQGILRLSPTWVPRSFLHPGRRLRLHPDDYYALGAARGGIDERWFASTTEAANDGRQWHEGLSFCVHGSQQFLLRDAVAEMGKELTGEKIWDQYKRWPVYSKFFDNMGPIPHHMHQNDADAALVGRQGKPEAYYFPPQYNNCDNHFPYTFMGLEPGTSREDVARCISGWFDRDNQIVDLSRAYRLRAGTGWLIPPGVLHAPGSLCTYEPQWGSDVFSMFQNVVEGRFVPRELLVKDMPAEKHGDVDFIVGQLDWERNIDPNFRLNNYIEPVEHQSGAGWIDRWVVYGRVAGRQLFSARELTVAPGAVCELNDGAASGWVTIQGCGRIGPLDIQAPTLIRFGEMTSDEVFISAHAASGTIRVENTGREPLVGLRYFGPDAFESVPEVGAHRA